MILLGDNVFWLNLLNVIVNSQGLFINRINSWRRAGTLIYLPKALIPVSGARARWILYSLFKIVSRSVAMVLLNIHRFVIHNLKYY